MILRLALLLASACGRVAFDAGSDSASPDTAPADELLYFSFESSVVANEGTGPDAVCTSCPTLVAGPRAGTMAAQFAGAQCLTIDAPTLRPLSLTFAAWMRRADLSGGTVLGLAQNGATGPANTFEIWVNGTSDIYVELASMGFLEMAPAPNVWGHYAGVYAGSELTVYANGVAIGTQPNPAPAYAGDPYRIGCDMDSSFERGHWTGTIDEVRLYDRALSAAEIAALAQP